MPKKTRLDSPASPSPGKTTKPERAANSITAFAKPVNEQGTPIKSANETSWKHKIKKIIPKIKKKHDLEDLGEKTKKPKESPDKLKADKESFLTCSTPIKQEKQEFKKKEPAPQQTEPEKAKLTKDVNKPEKEEEEETEDKQKSLNVDLSKYLVNLQRISLRDKIFFTKNLGVMLKAGLSLGQALKALAEQTSNPKFKKILSKVNNEVEKGQSFAKALKQYPKTFPELFVSMIESGEVSGNMEEVLKQLHKQMTRDHELISRVRGAMIYPCIVVTAMIGIGTAMIIFVIPKFISIFAEVQAELPLPTRILIGLSHFITANGFFVALGIIIVVGSFIAFFKTKDGKNILHCLFLKLPILKTIVKKINLARFSRTLSSLLKTNIPIVDAFHVTAKVVGNVHYKKALKQTAEKIKKGERVHKCLKEHKKLFPAVVIQMVTVGEESGSIESILEEVANFYEDDVDQTMKNLPTIIEPILMIILGLGVGFMAVAVLMPMYSLSQSI